MAAFLFARPAATDGYGLPDHFRATSNRIVLLLAVWLFERPLIGADLPQRQFLNQFRHIGGRPGFHHIV